MTYKLIPPHGGYKKLESFKNATIVYDFTDKFCEKYVDKFSRTYDQMIQASRSGKQCIAEGSLVSGTSKKNELKQLGWSRSSLGELLEDYEDFLRQNGHEQWSKDDPRSLRVRKLAYKSNKSYKTYETYMASPENAANAMVCLINQANYLLDRQIEALEKEFEDKGGFTERMYRERRKKRGY